MLKRVSSRLGNFPHGDGGGDGGGDGDGGDGGDGGGDGVRESRIQFSRLPTKTKI